MATLFEPEAPSVTPQEAEGVRRPLLSANFLPPRVYVDQKIFDEEIVNIFRSNWLPYCHVSQLPDPATFVARDMFDESLVATRDKDGVIRVLSNVCRHRNALLASGSGKCRGNRLTCPYHGWVYGLDGKLLAAPHMGETEDFLRAEIRLPEVRHEIWNGFVFVNIDGKAPPLAPQLETLDKKLAPYQLGKMRAVEVKRATVDWNWKISLENFSEAYHQPFIHHETTDHLTPAAKARYDDSDGPWAIFWLPTADGSPLPTCVPSIPGMPESYYDGFCVFNVFPLLHIYTDSATPLWLDWEIKSVNEHDMIWYMLVHEDNDLTPEREHEIKEEFMNIIGPILAEDVAVCQAVSKGVRSTLAQPGRLSHMEKAVHHFQRWWLDQMAAAR